MDLQKENNRLREQNRQLHEELESLKKNSRNSVNREMIFKVFRSSSHLMALINLSTGSFTDVNDTFLETLGYSADEVIDRNSCDINIFPDIEDSLKYLRLISRLKKVKDYPVILKTREGEDKAFFFSAETMTFEEEAYLMIMYQIADASKSKKINEQQGSIAKEIFETVSHYLALFCYDDNRNIFVVDLNHRVEQVEFISREEVIGKNIEDTPLGKRIKLTELLEHIRITGEANKLSASVQGDDSEGYYLGFPLSSGNIVVTWEPGHFQKNLDDFNRQELLFREFAELLPEMIYEVDRSGKIIYGNKFSLDFFGYSVEDLKKGVFVKDIFPDRYEDIVQNLNALRSPGESSVNEYYAMKKDGTRAPVVTHSFATFLHDKIVSYRGVLTDISKQKEYEDQINREKAFLEHIYNSIPAAIVITNSSGIVSMINREFTELFGYMPEEAVNNNINNLIVPDDLIEEAEIIDELAEQNTKEIRQTIRQRKDGRQIQVTVVASAIVINNETVAHLGIYRDITTEKKTQLVQEILYNISTSALKQFDIGEIYPVIVKELSKIWDTNNFFIALYDKTKDTLSLPFFSDEKDSFYEIPTKNTITGWVIKQNKSVLLGENDLKKLEESGDIELIGTPCKVWMGVPLRVENEIIGVMCLQDYNDEMKFTQEDLYIIEFIANQVAMTLQRRIMLDNLIQARQRAENAAFSKQQFMSTMSHEIRTPLNEVIGITNLLLQGNPREDQMDFINTLKFSGNHLLTLVNDVLDYNKMESGKIVFEQTQFSLSQLLAEIKRSYSFRAQAKRIDFDIIKGNNLPDVVTGDPIRLNQILSNLLSNALKFTDSGIIRVKIRELAQTKDRTTIEFVVSDTGIGIPKEMHHHVFESFTQATPETTRQFGGTGLGLAICKKLVELQGGQISLDSEPGKGSSFTFDLPFGIVERGTVNKSVETDESYSGLEGKKILVAEDNKVNFFVANKFLTNWGVKVTHAENGQLALDFLKEEEFDLILMDLHMPVLDGIEATRIIRNSTDEKIKNIPIVALTAAIMSESHDKIENLKINDYVLKPFKPHDLFDRIKKNIL
ncbi:MAG TPA: PAS domain S-box protein [Bacteroidales bacterium]|nr:PAS domain S-box protein [Bacteroidales bacterium]